MDNLDVINNLPKNFKKSFELDYAGSTDINSVLDLTRYKDDLDGLVEEMERQPAVYAYWSNLKRIASENLDKVTEEYEIWKSTKIRTVVEHIASDGVKTPTSKLIDAKFLSLYQKNELNINFRKKIDTWKRRYEMLSIVERSVESRKDQFRSLSFLLSNMMNNGLLNAAKKRPKNLKPMEVDDGES